MWLIGFGVMFPFGQLYARGHANKWMGSIAAGLVGLSCSLLLSAPDFSPRAAIVAATILLTVVPFATMLAFLTVFESARPRKRI
jgi:hypothetical protein